MHSLLHRPHSLMTYATHIATCSSNQHRYCADSDRPLCSSPLNLLPEYVHAALLLHQSALLLPYELSVPCPFIVFPGLGSY